MGARVDSWVEAAADLNPGVDTSGRAWLTLQRTDRVARSEAARADHRSDWPRGTRPRRMLPCPTPPIRRGAHPRSRRPAREATACRRPSQAHEMRGSRAGRVLIRLAGGGDGRRCAMVLLPGSPAGPTAPATAQAPNALRAIPSGTNGAAPAHTRHRPEVSSGGSGVSSPRRLERSGDFGSPLPDCVLVVGVK